MNKTYIKNLLRLILILAIIITVASCTSSKQIIYFQDIDETELKEIKADYITKIKKDDLLSIVVSGQDKDVVMPFNLTLTEVITSTSGDPSKAVLPYLVDSEGCIDFPTLGRIKVEGMTRIELTDFLKNKISEFVKDPIVSISFTNYKITILGEVRNPGTYTMPSERTTLLQALGMAGDLAISAKRDGILLIREVDGVQKHVTIDLRSAEIMNSPYFYLHQNDVIYVPPSSSRIVQGTTASIIWSITSTTVSTLATILTLILTLSNLKK